jgi:hypothetical protein
METFASEPRQLPEDLRMTVMLLPTAGGAR